MFSRLERSPVSLRTLDRYIQHYKIEDEYEVKFLTSSVFKNPAQSQAKPIDMDKFKHDTKQIKLEYLKIKERIALLDASFKQAH